MSAPTTALLQPIAQSERIQSIDVLRGMALLGILLMNILEFGLPGAAYDNLRLWGGDSGANLWVFVVQYILFEGKMRALFSMMFGASIVLLTERGATRGGGLGVADLYFRRMLWMVLFGIAHAYLIWHGDILYPYAVSGLLLFVFRHWPPHRLMAVAAAMFILTGVGSVFEGHDRVESRKKGEAAMALDKQGVKLNDEQKKAKEDWEATLKRHNPPREELVKEVEAYRASYAKAFAQRAKRVREWHSGTIYDPGWFDFWGMMMLGMALLRLGVLQGERPFGFYARLALTGYVIGIPVNAWSVYSWVASGFDLMQAPFSYAPYHLGRVAVAMGHLGVVMMVFQRRWLPGLVARLSAVGQMALSNYIAHSVICSFVFYSHGFKLIGQLERYQLYFVVVGIWIFNLMWSQIWLRYYRFGPLEWCWRSLTYWQRQPMRIAPANNPVMLSAADLPFPESDRTQS